MVSARSSGKAASESEKENWTALGRTVAAMTGEPLAPAHVGAEIKNFSCSQYQLYMEIERSR